MMVGNMLKSRNGMVFNIMIVLFTIIILSYAFARLSAKMDVEKEIGETQLEAIVNIQEGEKALVFLDFAAQMAVYQAIYDLQQQGGVSESGACGTYYGFNRWNSESGQDCFVDADSAQDTLRDLFVNNLVARVAAYPSADFIGNVPDAAAARGASMAAQRVMGVAAESAAGSACGETEDFMDDFTYSSDSGFFPEDGGRVWVPSRARCAGSYPLIVFLHGCLRSSHARPHVHFGDGADDDIIPITSQLIASGDVQPLILAAPSQTRGDATWRSSPESPCGDSLWGDEFDVSQFLANVRDALPQGVQVSGVSFVGHSGAGCSVHSGTQRALGATGVFALGHFDTCASSALGESLKTKLGSDTKFLAIYGTMGSDRDAQDTAMNLTDDIDCPSSEITGGGMAGCKSGASGRFLGFGMQSPDHGTAVSLGMEQFLKRFFAASQAPSTGDGGGAQDGQDSQEEQDSQEGQDDQEEQEGEQGGIQ